MFEIKEFYKKSEPGFTISIQTPHEDDLFEKRKHCLLNIKVWKYSAWIKVPEIFKPKKKWVDTSMYEWATAKPDGTFGFFEDIPRQYGFSFVQESGIHVYYGIQPGCWMSYDTKNSDHTKVLNYFWNWHHVRHTAYDIDGKYLCDGKYFQDWGYANVSNKPFNKETRAIDFQTIPFFSVYDPNVEQGNSLDGISTNREVFRFFDYIDPTDNEKTVARCNIEEREWIRGSWKWLRAILKYLPKCRMIKRTINIEFREEVGSRKGSWKGGTIGTGFNMLPGETLTQCWIRFCKDWSSK